LATREDVARLAGVSGATVSHVVNNSKKVSPELQQKVHSAISELDYHPNLIGRSLVSKRTRHVAFLVDNLMNPHYCETLEGIQQAAVENGYIVSVLFTSISNMKTVADLVGHGVDGAILTHFDTKIGRYLREKILCITHDQHVYQDYRDAVFSMVECFKNHGHKKIAFISGLSLDTSNSRYVFFCEAMKHYGLELDPLLIYEGAGEAAGKTDEQSGAAAVREILSRNRDFTALFALNDLMCIGAAAALRAAGFSIPGDISLAGCDNLKILKWYFPSLSTIDAFPVETGKALMMHLIETLENAPPVARVIRCEFLKKESISRVKRGLVSA
jgi:LacI family transcriptional regulator